MILFDRFIVRFKASATWVITVAGILAAHSDLLHLGEVTNDRLIFVALIILAFNNPIASQMKDRK